MLASLKSEVIGQLVHIWGHSALPDLDGDFQCPKLQKDVLIRRDEWGVPHISGSCINDVMFATGIVHAQDRFWQMDLNRRVARGKLSELLGLKALELDKFSRTLGWARLAEHDWEAMHEENQQNEEHNSVEVIEAYVAGVNFWLSKMPAFPPEYRLLRKKPQPFSPIDVVSVFRLMCFKMSYGWEHQLVRARLINVVGPENARFFDILDDKTPPIVPPSELSKIDLTHILSPDNIGLPADDFLLASGQGSNGWAVSGDRTASGHAILCNDPHLAFGIPNVMYECHMRTSDGKIHCTGATMPGMPLLLIGHTEFVAWGITLGYVDGQDIFIEKFENDDSHRYEVDGEMRDATVFSEEIIVSGEENPVIFEVLETRHGPIISKSVLEATQGLSLRSRDSDDDTNDYRLALASALRAPKLDGISNFTGIKTARSARDLEQVVLAIGHAYLNICFADVDDNIGYALTGDIPIRGSKNKGMVPTPGWTRENDWVAFVPTQQKPHCINPEGGLIVSANHRVEPKDYPYFLGAIYRQGFRARVLNSELEKNESLRLDDCTALQMNEYSVAAEDLIEICRDVTVDCDKRIVECWKRILEWDFILSEFSVAGAIFQTFFHALAKRIIKTGLEAGEATEEDLEFLNVKIFGESLFQALNPVGTSFKCRIEKSITRILEDRECWWMQHCGGIKQVITQSLQEAAAFLESRCGPNISDWRWGRIHTLTIDHPLGKVIGPKAFAVGPFEQGGNTTTVCLAAIQHTNWDEYGRTIAGAVYRQVIDMGSLSEARNCLCVGQSGNPASKNYKDQMEMWRKGEMKPMLWDSADVNFHTCHTLRLGPHLTERRIARRALPLWGAWVGAVVVLAAAVVVGLKMR
eukprot:198000_1